MTDLQIFDPTKVRGLFEEKESEIAQLRAELERLKRGDFTPEEIHDICHNLHGKVGARVFADACAKEQRKLYGCAPDADQVENLLALSLCENCGESNEDWALPRYCQPCWNVLVGLKLKAEQDSARYQWIRANPCNLALNLMGSLSSDAFDGVIDVAMAKDGDNRT